MHVKCLTQFLALSKSWLAWLSLNGVGANNVDWCEVIYTLTHPVPPVECHQRLPGPRHGFKDGDTRDQRGEVSIADLMVSDRGCS